MYQVELAKGCALQMGGFQLTKSLGMENSDSSSICQVEEAYHTV